MTENSLPLLILHSCHLSTFHFFYPYFFYFIELQRWEWRGGRGCGRHSIPFSAPYSVGWGPSIPDFPFRDRGLQRSIVGVLWAGPGWGCIVECILWMVGEDG